MEKCITIFDVESFILAIHERPALWKISSSDYANKTKKSESWREVCCIYNSDFDELPDAQKKDIAKELRMKWKNLRSSFLRDFKKQREKNSGLDGDVIPKYVYADMLSFLLPVINEKETSSSMDTTRDYEEELEYGLVETILSEGQAPLTVKRPAGQLSDIKRLCDVLQQGIEEHAASANAALEAQRDEDTLFMLSLVKDLKDIPSHVKFQAKCEIMGVIAKYK